MSELLEWVGMPELLRMLQASDPKLKWNRQNLAYWLGKAGIETRQLPGFSRSFRVVRASEAEEVCRKLRDAREHRKNDGHGGGRIAKIG